MKTNATLGLGLMALLAGGAAVGQAQKADRLSPDCRQELVRLCRGAGGGFMSCALQSRAKLSPACQAQIAGRTSAAKPLPDGFVEERYGADPKQTLAYDRPVMNKPVPLLVFVHGGGWSIGDKSMSVADKAKFATDRGWAFATVNYRLVPGASVEQQAADVAAALAWLRAHARERGFDADRIVLMGHSAGAHLVALVGTDPAYLNAAGVPMGAVKGEVLLDGAGYDIAAQMAPGASNPVKAMYEAAFGPDVARQKALSPTLHAAAPNVANWLILPIERRAESQAQSRAFAAALTAAGAHAAVQVVPGESHMTLNRGFGEPGDAASEAVDAFLRTLR